MDDTFLLQQVKVSDEVLFQEIEGESVLLNLATEQYFGLDEVGTRIWHLLSEDGKPANVLTKLQKVYDIDRETLQNDLAGLINELKMQGLIVVSD